jgi:hypothetical protein
MFFRDKSWSNGTKKRGAKATLSFSRRNCEVILQAVDAFAPTVATPRGVDGATRHSMGHWGGP